MKPTAVTILAVALAASALDGVRGDGCMSHCRTRLLDSYEADCAKWREELPRPDLYTHCQQGYSAGREAACNEYCGHHPNERRLDGMRMDACAEFRARPPNNRMSACSQGFSAARARARALPPLPHDEKAAAAVMDAVKAAEADDGGAAAPKRKLSVKRQVDAKNILEAAREEAAAAFQEAKATEL